MDEADIQRLADQVMDIPELAQTPPETRASLGHDLALIRGMEAGLTDKGSNELARLVKRRIQWTIFANRRKPTDQNET